MKRAAVVEAANESKRIKTGHTSTEACAIFDDPSLKRHATDILKNGTDNIGYISAKAFMTWPAIKKKARMNVETIEGDRKHRFDVEFSGQCAEFFDKLHFDSQDQFLLSLKGAQIEKKQKSSSPCSLAMNLKYPEGVVVKFVKRSRRSDEDGQVVDTWKLREATKVDDEDWFRTPRDSPRTTLLSAPPAKEPEPMIVDEEGIEEPNLPSTNTVAPDPPRPTPSPPSLRESTNVDMLPPPTAKGKPVQQTPSPPCAIELPSTDNINVSPPSNLTNSNDTTMAPTINSTAQSHTQPPEELINLRELEPVPAPTPEIAPEIAPATAPESVSGEVPKLSKKKARKLRKARREREAAGLLVAHTKNPSPSTSAPLSTRTSTTPAPLPLHTSASPALLSGSNVAKEASTSVQQIPRRSASPVIQPVDSTSSLQPKTLSHTSSASPSSREALISEDSDPALMLRAGYCTAEGEVYHALASLVARSFSAAHHVVGVVTSINTPYTTSKGDWTCSLVLVDPSNCNLDGYSNATEGFRINCFTKKYKEWLPSAQCGDVLIARNVKVSQPMGVVSGVGYHDQLRWSIFSPSTGKAHHGNIGNAPTSEGLAADGYGLSFSPFWNPIETELAYCLKLADWWRAVQEKRQKEMGHVYQIGSGDWTENWGRPRRQHRLINEAGPDVPPNGFFDCTAEVLHGHLNDNEVYSLYITDYTANESLAAVQGSWCLNGLADRVLKVEMWGKAADIGPTMVPGEYYCMRNNRMKISRGGYVEGTISDAKIQQLDETDAENHPHLKALLERKAQWEKDTFDGSSPAFQHRLFQDVVKDVFFTCTVEVLHVITNRNGTYLYVTDYTSHPDLPPVCAEDPWSRGLQGRIVKISIREGQIETAQSANPGSYYTIRNLRLKKSTTGREFQGQLGGGERLIQMLRTQNTANENLKELIRRKEEWKQQMTDQHHDRKPQRPRSVSGEPAKPSHRLFNRSKCSTIKEILAIEKSPNKFRLIAHAVDFYPLRLKDCVVLYCAQCKQDIPKNRKACLDCDDVDHEYVRYSYRFFFRVEDEEGTPLPISVSDQCPLLEGLEPKDLHEDGDAFREFSKRLEPIIGNLVDVHESILSGKKITTITPMLEFSIDSWNISADGVKAYGFMNYDEA